MRNRQLTFAREHRGYTQSELANAIKGLSQSTLSKFEKGLLQLDDELFERIANFLNFPMSFFEQRMTSFFSNAHYRRKSTITKSTIQEFERGGAFYESIIDNLSDTIEWPEFKFQVLDLEDNYTPQYVAQYTRLKLRINPEDPIRDIFSLLEQNGIIVIEVDVVDKIDGVSFCTEKGNNVIIINKNFPNDRKRFTLAHELGHLLMHNERNYPIPESRDRELEANQFASEFLAPASAVKKSLYGFKLSDLAQLKRYWLISFASLIRRAKDLGCLDERKYKYFLIEMSRLGYNKTEPVTVPIDRPTLFSEGINLLKDELGYDSQDFQETLYLPQDLVESLIGGEQKAKLKLKLGGKFDQRFG